MSSVATQLRVPLEDLDYVLDAVGDRWEHLRGQQFFLTGGTGFIGKWLLATFLHANRTLKLDSEIFVLSRSPEAFLNEFSQLRQSTDICWLEGDVRDLDLKAVENCRFCIHAATDVAANRAPAEILETCVSGTQRVLQAMSGGASERRLLLLSSGAVYGKIPEHMLAVPESWMGGPDPLQPGSAYGEGKRVSELMCTLAAAATPGLSVSIARCFAFVGPHLPLDKHFAIGNFIKAAMSGCDIQIQGDGTPLRSYLYAADLAYWLWVLLFDAPSARAYNVGGAESISIAQLARRVNDVLGGLGGVHIAQSPKQGASPQAYVPSIERIETELRLIPTINLDDAILKTAQWAGYKPGSRNEKTTH